MPAVGTALEQALSGQNGPVRTSFRFEVHSQANAFLADVTNAFNDDCVVTMDNEADQTWSLDGSLDYTVLIALFPSFVRRTHWIAPYMDILVSGSFQSFQLGLYRLNSPERDYDASLHETWQFTSADIGSLLARAELSDVFVVPGAGNYISYVRTLIDSVGLSHSIVDPGVVADNAQAWLVGVSKRSVANDLLFGARYYPIYPTAAGVLTSKLTMGDPGDWSNPTNISIPGGLVTVATDVTYSAIAEPRMVASESPAKVTETDVLYDNFNSNAYNDPLQVTTFTYQQSNDDAASQISTVTTGVKTVWDHNFDRVPASQMQALGTFHLLDQDSRVQLMEFQTLPDPRRAPHEFYTVNIPNIPTPLSWRCFGWTLPLRTGQLMTHRVGAVYVRNGLNWTRILAG